MFIEFNPPLSFLASNELVLFGFLTIVLTIFCVFPLITASSLERKRVSGVVALRAGVLVIVGIVASVMVAPLGGGLGILAIILFAGAAAIVCPLTLLVLLLITPLIRTILQKTAPEDSTNRKFTGFCLMLATMLSFCFIPVLVGFIFTSVTPKVSLKNPRVDIPEFNFMELNEEWRQRVAADPEFKAVFDAYVADGPSMDDKENIIYVRSSDELKTIAPMRWEIYQNTIINRVLHDRDSGVEFIRLYSEKISREYKKDLLEDDIARKMPMLEEVAEQLQTIEPAKNFSGTDVYRSAYADETSHLFEDGGYDQDLREFFKEFEQCGKHKLLLFFESCIYQNSSGDFLIITRK